MYYNVIITGATGMVGEGVLHECLQDPEITEVLLINRRPSGFQHPKLREVIHPDFLHFRGITVDFKNYQACFFCLGVSSVGMSKADYEKQTYDLTLEVARTMAAQNPEMTFCYVTGAGTDSSEKGRSHWARVKGKTENELLRLFKKAFMFRPAFIQPTPGLKNTSKYYKYISFLEPVLKRLFPKYICTLREVGQAMIQALKKGYPKPILEVPDIKALARSGN
ncbi:NAD-dependent epimerase/dehydratase family protein [Adhaeribacter sp. BT258]|uniref:NAD-dependent epimerase/dehydratase family protein n=1 Tax=Adhaeribacter terrigena TaxID=2793070 RepID=A0ABS1C053_9BACT|nr:NAD-dependent epimerase/dehydratase family protein [Adhaeribacter terrigena]MBK0402784.1 NAD-dependent epimerase/dehydratase family protein [Adhaeribacter terrigena]